MSFLKIMLKLFLPIGKRRKASPGFTLIEVLTVTSVIGILAAIASLSGNTYKEKAKIARAQAEIDRIHKAIVLLELDTGLWPGHQKPGVSTSGSNEVWDLAACSAGLLCNDGGYSNWNGPYLTSISKDPWGMDYFLDTDYLTQGKNRAVLGSFGPNKAGKNMYDSDDVIRVIY
jgi:prepilin-type N-terminal cleavage/methylation domain-containing protein